MVFKIVIHKEASGGFWAEVPAIAGCASQGDSVEELVENIREAIRGCLAAGAEVLDADAEVLAVAL
ncbi:type II toxin-antitoxin system HicB family antitoxin [bacterium]|nr:MAG: type II toxin-antitoxin system HicB family antitoxin [bacterium]